MWTYVDEEGLIENVTVRRKYLDGVHRSNQLLAHEGYALKLITDEGYTDEDGYHPPTYSYQVTLPLNGDIYWYEAVLIEPGMDVISKPKKEEVI